MEKSETFHNDDDAKKLFTVKMHGMAWHRKRKKKKLF